MKHLLAMLVTICAARVAHAYPQFQLERDPTCTGCHLSPAGGGLLNENGLSVASSLGLFGGAPEAAHGLLVGPDWLTLGGDGRWATGLVETHGPHAATFPMQGELYAHAKLFTGFSAYVTAGIASGDNTRPVTYVLSREHYVKWQADDNSSYGLFIRAGRFMPVYGLRIAEHPAYTRRYGGTPLYGETYGIAAEYIEPAWEIHATGFVHDPIQDPIERGNGGALYAETRTGPVAIGVQGRYAKSPDDARTMGGATLKWLATPSLLISAEASAIHQKFTAGSSRNQIVSYILATWFFADSWFVDVAVGQFDEDLAAPKVDREAIDVNLHWFASSHLELLLTNRVQAFDYTAGGRSSGWTLLQLHYRL